MLKNGLVTLFGFESDISHLLLAKCIGDTVRETWEAMMRHSRRYVALWFMEFSVIITGSNMGIFGFNQKLVNIMLN